MRLKLLKTLVLICLPIGLSACMTNIKGDLLYADYTNDTPETIRQIDRNNVAYDELCDVYHFNKEQK